MTGADRETTRILLRVTAERQQYLAWGHAGRLLALSEIDLDVDVHRFSFK